jgi:hypothetical protein
MQNIKDNFGICEKIHRKYYFVLGLKLLFSLFCCDFQYLGNKMQENIFTQVVFTRTFKKNKFLRQITYLYICF